MEESSGSGVKGDYSDRPENKEPEPIKPVEKKYGTEKESQDHWNGVKVDYQVNIKPDKNGRLRF